MASKSLHTVTTRVSDLDSLRHVNNRIYEQFCSDSRYRLLEEQGNSLETLQRKGISLRPIASFVKFHLQQRAGTSLAIETRAYPLGAGLILWDHTIKQLDGTRVCHVQAKVSSQDQFHESVELLPVTDEEPDMVLIEEVPDFSGNCQRVANEFSPFYSDMDYFGDLPAAAWWRMYEEGRHMAGNQLGLTLERFIQFDTHLFWVSGNYHFHQVLKPGRKLIAYTWLERITGIRAYIRQEIRSYDGEVLMGGSREEHLIVSLQKSRPKVMPSELANRLEAYVEFPE